MPIAVVYRPPALTAEKYMESWADGSPMRTLRAFCSMPVWARVTTSSPSRVGETPEAYDAFASRFKEALGAEGFEGGAPKILPVHHTIDHGVPA
jgi:hypothetical protein